MCTIVALLLAPYAGCSAVDVRSHTSSDESSAVLEEHEASSQRGSIPEKKSSPGTEKSLGQIEDLLAN